MLPEATSVPSTTNLQFFSSQLNTTVLLVDEPFVNKLSFSSFTSNVGGVVSILNVIETVLVLFPSIVNTYTPSSLKVVDEENGPLFKPLNVYVAEPPDTPICIDETITLGDAV